MIKQKNKQTFKLPPYINKTKIVEKIQIIPNLPASHKFDSISRQSRS